MLELTVAASRRDDAPTVIVQTRRRLYAFGEHPAFAM
jgi:hypothetical protein